ncbi:hypothetical protein FRC08_017085 [Ceratobasidium sp. 394]|nr:hypothetical protein FRC08_017085 [Ceratobasidium sp. 394]
MAPSSSYHTLPSKPQLAWTPKSESVGVTSGTIPTAAPADALVPDRLATQPQRRKFRPIMRDRPQVGKSFAPGTGAPKHPLNEQLDSNANTLLCAADPPAKRQRVDETLATTSTSLTSAPEINAVKLEEPTEPLLVPSRDQATSGTEFISYDKYPKCLSSCGIPAKQLLNNRLSIKGMRVRALQKRGLIVGAVFVRDDGIAIDWSLPPGSKVNGPIPSTETPVPQPGTPVDSSLALPSQRPGTPPLSSESPPPHLDPSSTSAHAPPDQHPATPTSTEVAYREIIIPPRCLPLRGDTRKLEIWVVEQMHLLEAELGPGLDLQPELLGIGEYLTGQRVPDDATSRMVGAILLKAKLRVGMPPL